MMLDKARRAGVPEVYGDNLVMLVGVRTCQTTDLISRFGDGVN